MNYDCDGKTRRMINALKNKCLKGFCRDKKMSCEQCPITKESIERYGYSVI